MARTRLGRQAIFGADLEHDLVESFGRSLFQELRELDPARAHGRRLFGGRKRERRGDEDESEHHLPTLTARIPPSKASTRSTRRALENRSVGATEGWAVAGSRSCSDSSSRRRSSRKSASCSGFMHNGAGGPPRITPTPRRPPSQSPPRRLRAAPSAPAEYRSPKAR